MKKKDDKKYYITYQKMKVRVPYPRPLRRGICMACGRTKKSGEIKVTQMHHTKYVYTKQEVKKNPLLALDNALEVCFFDHGTADGFRTILVVAPNTDKLKHPSTILRVAKLLPPEQQARLELFCRVFLEWRSKIGRSIVEVG